MIFAEVDLDSSQIYNAHNLAVTLDELLANIVLKKGVDAVGDLVFRLQARFLDRAHQVPDVFVGFLLNEVRKCGVQPLEVFLHITYLFGHSSRPTGAHCAVSL